MISSGNGEQPIYRVLVSTPAKDAIQRLPKQAGDAGQGQAFLDLLRRINDRLRDSPLTFGEPLYRLPALEFTVYQAVMAPMVVD